MTSVEVWPAGWNAPLCVADCHTKNAPESEGERVANARLIAAAPELLEALKALLLHEGEKCFSGIGTEHDSYALEAAKNAAIAAIAKATGEAV
jgi:hypothetical protein